MSAPTEIFVPDDDWNDHYESPQEAADEYIEDGLLGEGSEFAMVRLQVGLKTTYRIVDGRAVVVGFATPVSLA